MHFPIWNEHAQFFVSTHVVSLFTYLFVWTYIRVCHIYHACRLSSNKTCSIVQATQKHLSLVIFSTFRFVTQNAFSKATNRRQFLVTFSQIYM